MKIKNKNYNKIYQEKLREDIILKDNEFSFMNGEISKYSEEQIIAAQNQNAKDTLNKLHHTLIAPATNSIIYLLYIIYTLSILPFLYCSYDNSVLYVGIVGYILLIAIGFISYFIEKYTKESFPNNHTRINYLINFSNRTSLCSYMLTSLGYMMIFLDWPAFWIFYISNAFIIVLSFYFDIIRPLRTKIRLK